MTLRTKPRNRLGGASSLLLAIVVGLILVLLFLRMVAFVAGTHHS